MSGYRCVIHVEEPAIGRFCWGLYSEYLGGRGHQEGLLCRSCADDLWEMCRGPVATLIMHFVIEPLDRSDP